MIFNYNEEELKKIGGILTLSEIVQQPKIWKEVLEIIKSREKEIKEFVDKIDNNTKIILTGAGTSEFVGSTIYPYLLNKGYDVESIPTTDIVTNLSQFINPNKKTLLVLFARSGNSPESVATFKMMSEYVKDLTHLVITCNQDGQLALIARNNPSNFVILLPEAANDKSFAMTSSFSSMMLTTILFFLINELDNLKILVNQTIKLTSKLMNLNFNKINEIAKWNHQRVVFLGSGVFKGLSQEASLKVLELSAGKITSFFNTPTGFRHGPKSILNQQSIVFLFLNSNQYARCYDLDLLKELSTQHQLDKLIVIDSLNDEKIKQNCDVYFSTNSQLNDDFFNALIYITYAQLYAFNKAVFLNNHPDNPWPSKLVNRVVEGVVIYPYIVK